MEGRSVKLDADSLGSLDGNLLGTDISDLESSGWTASSVDGKLPGTAIGAGGGAGAGTGAGRVLVDSVRDHHGT